MSTRPCASGSSRFALTLSGRIQFANIRSLAILSRYTITTQILVLCLLNLEIGNQRRYIKAMEDYFNSLISQVDLSSSAKRPDIETHISLRSETIGVKPCLAFTELVNSKSDNNDSCNRSPWRDFADQSCMATQVRPRPRYSR